MSLKTIEEKMNEGRQYRDINVSQFETRAEDDGRMTVRGYATTFDEPYTLWSEDGYTVVEQVDPHAFDECDMSDVIMQYNHEGRVFARNKNNTLKLNIDLHGLEIEAELSGTQIGRQLYEEIKGGFTDKMSFGFHVKKDKREVTEDHENGTITVLRTITSIDKLYDVSAVSIPANDATNISARNFGEGVIEEIKKELLARRAFELAKAKIKFYMEEY